VPLPSSINITIIMSSQLQSSAIEITANNNNNNNNNNNKKNTLLLSTANALLQLNNSNRVSPQPLPGSISQQEEDGIIATELESESVSPRLTTPHHCNPDLAFTASSKTYNMRDPNRPKRPLSAFNLF